MSHPLEPLVKQWLSLFKTALEFKRIEFQNDADEAYRFFDGTYEFLYALKTQGNGFVWSGTNEDMPKPSFCMTTNKTAELVQLFGPVLYHRNPIRTVTPRRVEGISPDTIMAMSGAVDPMMQQQAMMMAQQLDLQVQQQRTVDEQRAALISAYTNFTPEALDLKTEMRWGIDEALIKGLCPMWQEMYAPPGGKHKMAGTFFDSADNLLLDPDAKRIRDCKWIARRCVHPVWQVEREYGYQPGSLKGNMESTERGVAAEMDDYQKHMRSQGKTNDLLCYWKLYSRMGTGARLSGLAPEIRQTLDGFGDNCYLAIADGIPHPLNCGPDLIATGDLQAFMKSLEWPTPFWTSDDWPMTPIIFHDRPGKLYPMSHMKPGMGELKFLNWVYSFIASKIKTISRDFIVMAKSAAEEIKSTLLSGKDLELIEIQKSHGTIREVVDFLQHPQMNGDLWKVVQIIEENFERRVGLTELMYGSTPHQLRSAQEANIKANQLNVRPDDMATKVEEAASHMSRKEAFAAHWHLDGAAVERVLGKAGAMLWDQLVYAAPPDEIIFGLQYRIEAGSAKKPNKDSKQQNTTLLMQNIFTPLYEYASATGNTNPVNALIGEWCEANDIDPTPFMLPPMTPPVPDPAAAGQGDPAAQGGQQ